MAVPQITLRRKKASSPDFSRNVTFVWVDRANPMLDDNGDIIYTEERNEAGNRIPQYFEIPISKQLPTPLPSTIAARQTMMNDLLALALEEAKVIASQRAYNIADQTKIRALVRTVNDNLSVDYDGNAVTPT
jgi:hypothetical protein